MLTKTNIVIFAFLSVALVAVVLARVLVSTPDKPLPEVGISNEYNDMIRVTAPLPQSTIASPLTITGEARGGWFFEATFPVLVVDADGLIVGEGFATALTDWMTEDYVPFSATIMFTTDTRFSNEGSIILQKQNASGLAENDDAFEYPIFFETAVSKQPVGDSTTQLDGTSWQWKYTEYTSGERRTPRSDNFIISFDGDGVVSSATDCNTLTGSVVISGNNIQFGQFASTKMFCEDSQEAQYSSELGRATVFEMTPTTLAITLTRDNAVMHFTKN
jgi:heat shock protein HslJ